MAPKVSICLITYNHEKYILQALKGIKEQEANFEMECIISDDCSKDSTLALIKEEVQAWNINVKVLPNTENVGMHRNWEQAIAACSGEYIAILEGDDYWIDSRKLEKQVQYLDVFKDFSGCFTDAQVLNEVNDTTFVSYIQPKLQYFEAVQLCRSNMIPTCTVMFRKSELQSFPKAYFKAPYADWVLHFLLNQDKHYAILDECTGMYRLNQGGVYGGSGIKLKLQREVIELEQLLKMTSVAKLKVELQLSRMKAEKRLYDYLLKNRYYKAYIIEKWRRIWV